MTKKNPTNQMITYGKGFKSHLETNRDKIMLKCVFPKNIQPIRRASFPTGKFVLLDLPEKEIQKIELYTDKMKINCKNVIFY